MGKFTPDHQADRGIAKLGAPKVGQAQVQKSIRLFLVS